MSRDISTASIQDFNAVVSTEGWLVLLDLVTTSGTTRVVNNNTNVISGGQTYVAYAFAMALYNEDDEKLPSLNITIGNVDRSLIDEIRTMTTPPTAEIRIVPISNPDLVEIYIPDLTMRDINYDANAITGTLYFADILNQRFPKARYTPVTTPGMF
jgi:hypothetical protein